MLVLQVSLFEGPIDAGGERIVEVLCFLDPVDLIQEALLDLKVEVLPQELSALRPSVTVEDCVVGD